MCSLALFSKIKSIRIEKKLNQKDFSDFLCVPFGTFRNYESGRRKPSAEFLKKLIEKLKVNPDWLFKNEGEMFGKPEHNKPNFKGDKLKESPGPEYGGEDLHIKKISQILQDLKEDDKWRILNFAIKVQIERVETEETKQKFKGLG